MIWQFVGDDSLLGGDHALCSIRCDEPKIPMCGGLETGPLPEGGGEGEGAGIADRSCDRRDFFIRDGKQMAGALDAQGGDVLSG